LDDKALLKLLATGIGECAAAAQMNISYKKVNICLREYLAAGILKCNGERLEIDWRAFGQWKKQRSGLQSAEAA
jgi:hypothetical protein